MKTLYLLRHAKAERDSVSGEDFDRPLAERGRRDSKTMGKFLAERDWKPALVIYSPAARTQQTTELMAGAWKTPPRSRADKSLYLAEPDRIAVCIEGLADSLASAMVVGHNPGLEQLAEVLGERGDTQARDALDDGFPTCALAVIELDIDRWAELSPRSSRIVALHVAKTL